MVAFLVFGVLTVLFFIFLSSLFKEDESVKKEKEKNKRVKNVKSKKLDIDKVKYRDFVLSQFNNTDKKRGSDLIDEISIFYNLERSEATNKLFELTDTKLISPKGWIEDVEDTQFELHSATYYVDFRFPNFCHFLDLLCASQEFNKGVPKKWQREAFKWVKTTSNYKDKNIRSSIGSINFGIVKHEEANSVIPSLDNKITEKYGIYLYLMLDNGQVQKYVSSEVNSFLNSVSIDINENFSAILITVKSINNDKSEYYYQDILNELERNKAYQLLNN